MTVRDLILRLQSCEDQDAIVILQRDSEGNGFSPLRDDNDAALVEYYVAETTWSGEVYDAGDAPDDAVPCVTLVPIY